MKAANTKTWVSCYLFYTADPNQFLTDTIWPFVQRLKKEQLIRQFFFIRYHDEHGPHIRLRLLPSRAVSQQLVRQQVEVSFPAAKFFAYIPEVERYGGPDGVLIAEKLFDASSTAALCLMTVDKEWNYGRALASAMQMHIGMLQAFGVSRAETVALFLHIARDETHGAKSLDEFERGFMAQHTTIVPSLTALWNACDKDTVFKDEWFAQWRRAMDKIGAEIRHAQNTKKLNLPDSPQHDNLLWYLYESYIHMTNNRLGVIRRDESFMAYLLQKSLEDKKSP